MNNYYTRRSRAAAYEGERPTEREAMQQRHESSHTDRTIQLTLDSAQNQDNGQFNEVDQNSNKAPSLIVTRVHRQLQNTPPPDYQPIRCQFAVCHMATQCRCVSSEDWGEDPRRHTH